MDWICLDLKLKRPLEKIKQHYSLRKEVKTFFVILHSMRINYTKFYSSLYCLAFLGLKFFYKVMVYELFKFEYFELPPFLNGKMYQKPNFDGIYKFPLVSVLPSVMIFYRIVS